MREVKESRAVVDAAETAAPVVISQLALGPLIFDDSKG
jgi:hypothetical protein